MLPIRTILHPTDFSARAENALQVACALARDHHARLIVLHVRGVPVVPYGDFGQLPIELESQEAFRAKLDRLVDLRCGKGEVAIEHFVKIGDPAAEIVATAQEIDSDMIVMGTHGRTGLARLLMGSVAEQVVLRSPCAVLTIKAPLEKAEVCQSMRLEPAQA